MIYTVSINMDMDNDYDFFWSKTKDEVIKHAYDKYTNMRKIYTNKTVTTNICGTITNDVVSFETFHYLLSQDFVCECVWLYANNCRGNYYTNIFNAKFQQIDETKNSDHVAYGFYLGA